MIPQYAQLSLFTTKFRSFYEVVAPDFPAHSQLSVFVLWLVSVTSQWWRGTEEKQKEQETRDETK